MTDAELKQERLTSLKEALDSSSDKNRNFLIAFLIVEFYIFIAVLGTTDLDLFLAKSIYTFPFINFKISLTQFYFIAPLLLLAFHFNLLFNFLEHSKTLNDWLNQLGDEREQLLNHMRAFVLNTRAKYDNPNRTERELDFHALNIIIVLFVFIFPLALQWFILWKFAHYQDLLYSCLHLTCLLVSIYLVVLYWPGIQNPELGDKKRKNRGQLSAKQTTSLMWMKSINGLVLIVGSVSYTLLIGTLYTPALLNDKINNEHLAFLLPRLTIEDHKIKVLATNTIVREERSDIYKRKIEQLKAVDRTIKDIPHCQNNEQYQEINLAERSFRFIKIDELIVCNIKLKQSDLQFAEIHNSTFSGRFDHSNWSHGLVVDSHFQLGSNFNNFTAQVAFFRKVQLNHANMNSAKLQYTIFLDSKLIRADLYNANLHRTNFNNNDMQESILNAAINFDASLSGGSNFIDCKIDDVSVNVLATKFDECEINQTKPQIVQGQNNDDPKVTGVSESPQTEASKPNTPNIEEAKRRIAAVKNNGQSSIDLSNLFLIKLPSELLALRQLESIDLTNNQLDDEQLTLLINAMPNLQKLMFPFNKVKFVPPNIGQLTELNVLWAFGNQIERFPSSIKDLPIKHFYTYNNPTIIPPIEIIEIAQGENNFHHIKQWFEDNPDVDPAK